LIDLTYIKRVDIFSNLDSIPNGSWRWLAKQVLHLNLIKKKLTMKLSQLNRKKQVKNLCDELK